MFVHIRGFIHHNLIRSCNNALRLGTACCQVGLHRDHNLNRRPDSSSDSFGFKSILDKVKSLGITTSDTKLNALDSKLSSKEYHILYRFPHIRSCGIINKLKKQMCIVTGVGIPCSVLLKYADIISLEAMSVFMAAGGAFCFVFFAVGTIFHKLVGAVYLSKDRNTVKVSYLDFWGKRVDDFCPVTDIVPLSDIAEKTTDQYVNLLRYSTSQRLRFTLRYGIILDSKLFAEVFGKTD